MPERRQPDPIRTAIQAWLPSIHLEQDDPASAEHVLLSLAPKRFVIYEPMAQLPTGSFAQPQWAAILDQQSGETRARLWVMILDALSKKAGSTLTHLAVTAGIPLRREGDRGGDEDGEGKGEEENILRSPSGLRMLHGDFGPVPESGRCHHAAPQAEDFDRTLWVSTKQNGIRQTWAPRWTMFSRGNVKEKARLLAWPSSASSGGRGSAREGDEVWAVDLYAGIGYFVFSYASLGMRVLCWEVNPWSIEGLRRGALANGWTVKVLQGEELEQFSSCLLPDGPQIVVLAEDNQEALSRIRRAQDEGLARNIKHVNCGFLPTSEPTWKAAWDMTARSTESWLHLHENVGVDDIGNRRQALQEQRFSGWSAGERTGRSAEVEHVERVKTFAPGVWHCVFDVHITK